MLLFLLLICSFYSQNNVQEAFQGFQFFCQLLVNVTQIVLSNLLHLGIFKYFWCFSLLILKSRGLSKILKDANLKLEKETELCLLSGWIFYTLSTQLVNILIQTGWGLYITCVSSKRIKSKKKLWVWKYMILLDFK